MYFITDGTGSIWVETKQHDIVSPGDHVEAFGFPAVYNYTPVLEDAVFRKLGIGLPAQVTNLTAQAAQQRDHDDDLISVNGQLLYQFSKPLTD